MMNKVFGLLASGLLLLASCSQTSTPVVMADTQDTVAVTQPSANLLAIQQALVDLRAARAQVEAGGAVPVDESGQAVNLDAVIQSYEADLATASQAAPTAPSLQAQSLYTQYYFVVVDDDNFRANYGNWTHGFPGYNWGNDGCSGPASYTGYNDNFFWPCVQHDFGYRNARFTGNHNETTRSYVDSAFQRHMNQLCSRYSFFAKPGCYAAAKAFFLAVRAGGQSSFN